eukprot:scaffold596_cov236-Pinguiococcus_pyrenoidosus.AAC.21
MFLFDKSATNQCEHAGQIRRLGEQQTPVSKLIYLWIFSKHSREFAQQSRQLQHPILALRSTDHRARPVPAARAPPDELHHAAARLESSAAPHRLVAARSEQWRGDDLYGDR